LHEYTARLPDADSFARINRVLLLQSREGIGIDVSLGALPFEELAIRHATEFLFSPNWSIRTCSAEDLLVLKLFACRPMDLRDAEGVSLRLGQRLDWEYVEQQLRPLAGSKDETGILEALTRLRGL